MEILPPKQEVEQENLLLLKRLQELEAENVHLQQGFSNLVHHNPASHAVSPHQWKLADPRRKYSRCDPKDPREGVGVESSIGFCFNICQSVGQSLHVFDLNDRIIYWNQGAEKLYGHSASEALGQRNIELLTDVQYYGAAAEIIQNNTIGNTYTGVFPLKNKAGNLFVGIITNSPFYDDKGNLIGVICASVDSKPFRQNTQNQSSSSYPSSKQPGSGGQAITPDVGSHMPLQSGIASKFSNLASRITNKVRSKMKPGDCTSDGESQNADGYYFDRGMSETIFCDYRNERTLSEAVEDLLPSRIGVTFKTPTVELSTEKLFRGFGGEGKCEIGFCKNITSRAEAWISKKRMSLQWLNHECESDFDQQNRYDDNDKPRIQVVENDLSGNEASTSLSSFSNSNNKSSLVGSISTSSSFHHTFDMEIDSTHYDIMWEDLAIGAQIGSGSCGTVYRGLWCGSDVAIKEFSKIEYSDDLLHSFRQEVLLMKRLRHPNVLLFMGAVTSPQHLCIVTEYLPCGSLYQLLRRNSARLDWRRRALMAVDIAHGMNYLHRCKPPIVHRDLKSSNLLVDKNWNVKVGDFGLSRFKHSTYLTTKMGKGTVCTVTLPQPQWMAPEVIRNESSDEKSDVYSFGVVLWELATQKVPWDTLNTVQVIGAVGFMDRRMEIPEDIDPHWASLIESCWHSDPKCRPSFEELLEKLKVLPSRYSFQKPGANTRLTRGDF
ncbi:uncharacterized protein LOC113358101 isoform X1 [Papaver somniferum]|uniref:uncharacterized protein LOC113358101 isoform X1 n=1 Tax=Papaver somniferum TaxID=3469 RepID=UPI000E6FF61C|nr:uncharacterized protein LOC113358101 isoform X1 [Papaver somniferum]